MRTLAPIIALGLLLGLSLDMAGTSPAAASRTAAAPAVAPRASADGADAADEALDVVLFEHPQTAPVLHVTTLDGQIVDLTALRGKVVLVNFWATWCGPCREEIPALERLQRDYAGKVQVVGLSTDDIGADKVKAKVAQLGINYPVAIADDQLQRNFGGVPQIPATFVIDPQGRIEQRNRGAQTYAMFEAESRVLLGLPVTAQVHRVDQLSPNGKVGTVDIPGIAAELKALSPELRQQALAALNEHSCDCGCDQSLASCRVEDPSCGYSLPESKALIESLLHAPGPNPPK